MAQNISKSWKTSGPLNKNYWSLEANSPDSFTLWNFQTLPFRIFPKTSSGRSVVHGSLYALQRVRSGTHWTWAEQSAQAGGVCCQSCLYHIDCWLTEAGSVNTPQASRELKISCFECCDFRTPTIQSESDSMSNDSAGALFTHVPAVFGSRHLQDPVFLWEIRNINRTRWSLTAFPQASWQQLPTQTVQRALNASVWKKTLFPSICMVAWILLNLYFAKSMVIIQNRLVLPVGDREILGFLKFPPKNHWRALWLHNEIPCNRPK